MILRDVRSLEPEALIGQPDPGIADWLQSLGFTSRVVEVGGSTWIRTPNDDFQLEFRNGRLAEAVFCDPGAAKLPLRFPGGVGFGMSRTEVRTRLGAPTDAFEARNVVGFFGQAERFPPSDMYRRSGDSGLQFCYGEESLLITEISLADPQTRSPAD